MKALEDVIFSEFTKGIAESPHVGFADIRNLDLSLVPGVAQLGYLPTKVSSTTITNLPKWIRRDPNTGNFYCLDAGGALYKSTDGGVTWAVPAHLPASSGTGQGLAIYKGYVWVFRATAVDLMKISDDTWTNAWGGLTLSQTSSWHPGLPGQDDILYIGAGRYIDSVAEKSGSTFDPASSTTYTVSAKALTLPANYTIKCLAELGVNLMIGTSLGSDNTQFRVADIFPWNRTDTTFRLPIRIPENGCNQLFTYNNILYIQAGLYGTMYYYNGAQVVELKRFKNISFASASDVIDAYPDAIAFHNDKLLTGHVFSGAGTSPTPMGLWGLRGQTLTFENQISTGNAGGATGALAIGAIFSSGNTVFVGWRDGSTYGIDRIVTNGSTRYTSYAGYFDTDLRQVGTPNHRRTFTEVEFQLAKPLATGEGVKISYRKDLTSSFTVIGTFDFATYAGIQSFSAPASIMDAEFVQLRVALTTGSSSSTSPQLREARLR